MKYQTELMRTILKSEKARDIIDYVSPVYGESYVGLWLFQVIGAVMGDLCGKADQLRYDTNPATAELLLDLWEDHYEISRDPSLTTEQRRARLIGKTQSRGPCNPTKLAAAVSAAYGGIRVEIEENVEKNTFRVKILDGVTSTSQAEVILDRMKPAHLIYEISTTTFNVANTDIKLAIAMTHAEHYKVEVQ